MSLAYGLSCGPARSNAMLTIMCGIPGSGKTTELMNWQRSQPDVVLCPDEFRRVLTGQDYYGPAQDSVWSHVKTAARVLLGHGYDIIIDGTHLTVASRRSWIMIAKETGKLVDCIWLNIPFATCIARNQARDRVVPDEVVNRMCSVFVPPSVSEGFSNILEIREDGSREVRT